MSIKCLNAVWEQSQQSGTKLLVMLSLADWANDWGLSWYAIGRLAARCRTIERHTKRIVRELSETGELYILTGGKGPRDTSTYFVTVGFSEIEIANILTAQCKLDEKLANRIANQIVNAQNKSDSQDTLKGDSGARKGDSGARKRVTPTPPKPTVNPTVNPHDPPTDPTTTEDAPASVVVVGDHEWNLSKIASLEGADVSRIGHPINFLAWWLYGWANHKNNGNGGTLTAPVLFAVSRQNNPPADHAFYELLNLGLDNLYEFLSDGASFRPDYPGHLGYYLDSMKKAGFKKIVENL